MLGVNANCQNCSLCQAPDQAPPHQGGTPLSQRAVTPAMGLSMIDALTPVTPLMYKHRVQNDKALTLHLHIQTHRRSYYSEFHDTTAFADCSLYNTQRETLYLCTLHYKMKGPFHSFVFKLNDAETIWI